MIDPDVVTVAAPQAWRMMGDVPLEAERFPETMSAARLAAIVGCDRTTAEDYVRAHLPQKRAGQTYRVPRWLALRFARAYRHGRSVSRGAYRSGRPWSAEEMALLGTLPDAEVADRLGRTAQSCKIRRLRAGVHRRAP